MIHFSQTEVSKMLSTVQSLKSGLMRVTNSSVTRFSVNLLFTTLLLVFWNQAFAADDPLSGTDASLIATLGSNGTGRKFIYLLEGVTAIAAYIKTKNLMMFGGVVGIAVFLNVLFKVAGVTG